MHDGAMAIGSTSLLPRAVLLDLGNVLLFHDNALLFRRLAARAGVEDRAEELGRHIASDPSWTAANRGELDGEGIRERVCKLLGTDIPMPEFQLLWSSHFTPHEDVFPLVETLAKETKLVLVSNTNVLHAEYFLPQLPLLKKFRSLVLSCDTGSVKPEAELYELALKNAKVGPEEAVFFDDVPEYVDAAKALGMQGFVFTTAEQFRTDLRSLGFSGN